MIICKKRITIGHDCLISWNCLIMDTDWHCVIDKNNACILNYDKECIIGNHVWIGCNCTLLKGVNIPDNSVIAAGSTISKKLTTSNAIYTGTKRIKENINWDY